MHSRSAAGYGFAKPALRTYLPLDRYLTALLRRLHGSLDTGDDVPAVSAADRDLAVTSNGIGKGLPLPVNRLLHPVRLAGVGYIKPLTIAADRNPALIVDAKHAALADQIHAIDHSTIPKADAGDLRKSPVVETQQQHGVVVRGLLMKRG